MARYPCFVAPAPAHELYGINIAVSIIKRDFIQNNS